MNSGMPHHSSSGLTSAFAHRGTINSATWSILALRFMSRFSPFERVRITKMLHNHCTQKTADSSTSTLRTSFTIRGTSVTLVESWCFDTVSNTWLPWPKAQFRRAQDCNVWTLHVLDKHGRWLVYKPIPASKRLDFLLQVVDADRSGAFQGWSGSRASSPPTNRNL